MTTFADAVLRFAVATLLAGLWQAPLFAFAAWLILRFEPRANATTRHSVFAAALVAALFLPVATAALSSLTAPRLVAVTTNAMPLPRGARTARVLRPTTAAPETIRRPSAEPPAPALAVPAFERFAFTLPGWLTLTIAGLWFASGAVVLGRLLIGLVHLESLKRDALPLDVAYRRGLARWSSVEKGTRNVRLCVSDAIEIPIAVGLFDAMILVPQRLVDELEPSEIDAIVLHELAHLRRGDDWFNALERVAVALLFFNPGVLWLASQLDLEREVACDDWVLQQNDALPYASCLAKVAAAAPWPHRAATAPGIFASRRGMSIRIERLLAKQRDVRTRTSLGVATTAAAVIGTLGLGAALVSPTIAEETAPAPAPSTDVAASHVRPRSTEQRGSVAHTSSPERPVHVSIPAVHPAVGLIVAPIVRRVVAIATAPKIDVVPRTSVVVADAGSPDRVQAYRDLGYGHLSIDQLIDLRSAGVTPDFVRGLQANGLGHASIDDLIALRSTGVDATFVADMRRKYGHSLSARTLIELRTVGDDAETEQLVALRDLSKPGAFAGLRTLGADPTYIAAMRTYFGRSLTDDEIAGLRAMGVTTGYAEAMSAAGFAHLSPEQLDSMRALGISPDYVRSLASAGYGNLSVDDLQSLRALGIDGAFIERVRRNGFPHPSLDDLRRLKATGAL